MEEPLEECLDQFDRMQGVMENFLVSTVDLAQLQEHALDVLSDPVLLDAFRYLAAPPISVDDLKTLVEASSLAPRMLQNNPEPVHRLIQTIRAGLDRRRFPWVAEGRKPTPEERTAAVVATTALIATRRTETARRTSGKVVQEERVRQALLHLGIGETTIPGNTIATMTRAPKPGQFCRETVLGDRKADLIVGLWDGRIMPIECKVSNSSINSVKRLNNDAAVKAAAWIDDFGERHVVPAAVISGVYKLHNLEQAQRRGLTIYWAHRLSDLTDWIEQTRTRQ
ncbi:MAG: XamI family restriction endonuclease [Thermomicrobiales bacterium]